MSPASQPQRSHHLGVLRSVRWCNPPSTITIDSSRIVQDVPSTTCWLHSTWSVTVQYIPESVLHRPCYISESLFAEYCIWWGHRKQLVWRLWWHLRGDTWNLITWQLQVWRRKKKSGVEELERSEVSAALWHTRHLCLKPASRGSESSSAESRQLFRLHRGRQRRQVLPRKRKEQEVWSKAGRVSESQTCFDLISEEYIMSRTGLSEHQVRHSESR